MLSHKSAGRGCGFKMRRVCVFLPSSRARIIGAEEMIGLSAIIATGIDRHQSSLSQSDSQCGEQLTLGCGFREIGAAISRDRGRLFHGIAGSHFAVAGRLIDGFMGSGVRAKVKGFRGFSAHAFA